jgi:hypothetical protein
MAFALASAVSCTRASPQQDIDAAVCGPALQADAAATSAGFPPRFPIVPYLCGRVIRTPHLVTAVFAGDPYADTIASWGDWIVTSSWLASAGAEYGVGPGTHAAAVQLAGSAPAAATMSDVARLVAEHIADQSLPAPVDGVLYVVFFPESTQLDAGGHVECIDFTGYHSTAQLADGTVVPFAAIGRCTLVRPGLNELQNVERVASHEVLEAVTDPFLPDARAYDIPSGAGNDTPSAWREAIGEGELGDLCENTQAVFEAGFVAQRTWSNVAASQGRDPCVPATGAPYFSVQAPEDWYAVAPGSSVTVPLVGWSTAALPDWLVRSYVGTHTANFTVHTSSATTTSLGVGTYATTNAGRSLMVTVTAPSDAHSGDRAGITVRSASVSSATSPDVTREDLYHYTAFGVYVP